MLKAHLTATITTPADGSTYNTCTDFTVEATVENTGEATAEDVEADLIISANASVVSGADPQPLGDIIGGGSATATWTVHCDSPGASVITVDPTGIDANTGLEIIEDNTDEDSITVHQAAVRPGTRTMGFYKNHPCVVEQVLPITIVGEEVTEVDRVIEIIEDRDDHRSRLLSQLMVVKLNVAVFGIGGYTLEQLGLDGDETVDEVIGWAEELYADPTATKDELSAMQDLLDMINNSYTEMPLPEEIAEACPPGGGPPKSPRIKLNARGNLIGWVAPDIPVADGVTSLGDALATVWALNGGAWQMYSPTAPPFANDLELLEYAKGYFFYMNYAVDWNLGT